MLSLILWALIVVVTLKYVLILLRADNQGEGGTLSLLALAQRAMGRQTSVVLMAGLIGAALFYGDAAITPAIPVLSAVEGLSLVTSQLDAYSSLFPTMPQGLRITSTSPQAGWLQSARR